jgi:hypothetical protein
MSTHAKQAIVTRYVGPTNTKPSRIKATCDRGSVTISMPIEESGADAHAVAVRALLAKFQREDGADRSWPSFERWVCGGMPQASKDAYVWVQLPAPDASPEPPTERRLRDALAEILIAGGANGADVHALLKIAADALTVRPEGGAL